MPVATFSPNGEDAMAIEGLPGRNASYLIRSGDGERYSFGNAMATVIARHEDTGGLYQAAFLFGGKGQVVPYHRHPSSHKIYYVYDGLVSVGTETGPRLLSRGDFFSLPPNTAHDLRFLSHRSHVLEMAVGGDAVGLYRLIGETTSFRSPDPNAAAVSPERLRDAAVSLGLDMSTAGPQSPAERMFDEAVPEDIRPYSLEAGNGIRLVAADQVFTMLGLCRNTAKDFFVVLCEGPKGKRIPDHYHEKHSEVFVCVDGRVSMTANDEEIVLLPGDFLQVAAGTRHTYKLEDHFTRFFSILTPGVFEPFFFTIGEPYEPYFFPREPGPLRIDRVMQNLTTLDVKFTGMAGVGMRSAGWLLRKFRK
jgi:quercetin 2,3-dioxygenase